MQSKNIATLLLGTQLSQVQVAFNDSGKTYSYLSTFPVEEGDLVVVEGYNSSLAVVKVVEVLSGDGLDLIPNYSYKFVVDTVDLTKHQMLMSAQADLAKKIQQQRNKLELDSLRSELKLEDDDSFGILSAIKSFTSLFK